MMFIFSDVADGLKEVFVSSYEDINKRIEEQMDKGIKTEEDQSEAWKPRTKKAKLQTKRNWRS